jgi:hypothetical protein
VHFVPRSDIFLKPRSFMTLPGSILEERRENLHRRRKELEAQFMNTTNFSEQCRIAQQFGEVCEEEDAMLHGRTSRPQAEWMD